MYKKLSNTILDAASAPILITLLGVLFFAAMIVVVFIVLAIILIRNCIKKNQIKKNENNMIQKDK